MSENINPTQFPIPPKPQYNNVAPPSPPPPRRPNDSGSVKTLKIITVVLVVALLAALGVLYHVWDKSKIETAEKIQVISEKDQLTSQLEELKVEYGELRSGNDTLNAKLTQERKKIDVLMLKLKQTDANNTAKLKGFEKEMTNLKSLLKVYVDQIDALSKENQELRTANEKALEEINQSKKEATALKEEAGALKSMVEKGSELKTRDVSAVAINDREKVVTKARQVKQIKVCLALVENSLAKMGNHSVYIRVKSPDGSLLTKSVTNLFDPADGGTQLIFSAMRDVDYTGEDLEVCVYYSDVDFMSGTYEIEAYLDGALAGVTQLVLK